MGAIRCCERDEGRGHASNGLRNSYELEVLTSTSRSGLSQQPRNASPPRFEARYAAL